MTESRSHKAFLHSESFGGWLIRKQRSLAAKVIGKLFEQTTRNGGHVFLPEKKEFGDSLTRQIKQQGVVNGIATKLKDAADDYVDAKLDEIEHRIDDKLDQIDRRLAEWRDQEIANRLRIIKITLAGSILVALISLAYTMVKYHLG